MAAARQTVMANLRRPTRRRLQLLPPLRVTSEEEREAGARHGEGEKGEQQRSFSSSPSLVRRYCACAGQAGAWERIESFVLSPSLKLYAFVIFCL